MRAFVAVELSDEARERVVEEAGALRRSLGPDARALAFVRPEALHLTLKFLGDLDEGAVPTLATALRAIAATTASFSLELGALGTFPPRGEPRVVWIGVTRGASELAALAARVDDAASSSIGVTREARPFTAHLTLARVKRRLRGRAIATALAPPTSLKLPEQRVSSFVLLRSETRPDGAVHTPVEVFDFRGG